MPCAGMYPASAPPAPAAAKFQDPRDNAGTADLSKAASSPMAQSATATDGAPSQTRSNPPPASGSQPHSSPYELTATSIRLSGIGTRAVHPAAASPGDTASSPASPLPGTPVRPASPCGLPSPPKIGTPLARSSSRSASPIGGPVPQCRAPP